MLPLSILTCVAAVTAQQEHLALPVFVENRGQWDTPAAFVGRFPGLIVRAERGALVLQLFQGGTDATRGAIVRVEFEGASPDARLEAAARKSATYSFFLGDDAAEWRSGLPSYEGLVYRELYPGLDLHVGEVDGQPGLEVAVAPGADASALRLHSVGANDSRMEGGALHLATTAGSLALPIRTVERSRPGAVQRAASASTSPPPAVKVHWSTYLGSATNPFGTGDWPSAVQAGENGDVYVTGFAGGPSFPQTPGTYQNSFGQGGDVFVARMRGSDGALVYSSLVGGSNYVDKSRAIAVDSAGRATVAGETQSEDFPTTPAAFQTKTVSFFSDGFVFRLDASGRTLDYSTYLGGSGNELINGLDVDSSGAAVVGGNASPDFPTTTGAYLTSLLGSGNGAFVARLDPSGSLLEWATFLDGPSGAGQVSNLQLASNGDVVATGFSSTAYPVTPGAWVGGSGSGRAFATRLDANGSSLVWSSTFGGNNVNEPWTLAIGLDDSVVIGGFTKASNFPTTPGALRETYPGNREDGFVVRLDASGSFPIYSTYLDASNSGGVNATRVLGATVDASGAAILTGLSWWGFVTTPGSLMPVSPLTSTESFVCRLDPGGSRQLYSTFVGGPDDDFAQDVALFPSGTATVVGATDGSYPVTPNAYDPTFNGGQTDVFLTTFDLLPDGVTQRGESIPACRGPLVAGVSEMPAAGSATFSLTCSGAPPNVAGWLHLNAWPDASPVSAGALGTFGASMRIPARSDAEGWVEVPFP